MSKFFVQLLLSVLIGIGVTVGFRPDVRGEWKRTLREAKEFVGETVEAAFEAVDDVNAQMKMSVSAKAHAKATTNGNTQTNARVKGDVKGDVDVLVITEDSPIEDLSPEFSLDGSLHTNSQTNEKADVEDLELDLKNKTNSTLDLDLSLED